MPAALSTPYLDKGLKMLRQPIEKGAVKKKNIIGQYRDVLFSSCTGELSFDLFAFYLGLVRL